MGFPRIKVSHQFLGSKVRYAASNLWVTCLCPIGLTLIQEPDFPSVSSNPIAAQAVPQ